MSHTIDEWVGKPRLKWRDAEHTPYNKRQFQVKSTALLEVYGHTQTRERPNPSWLTIHVKESTTSDAGRVAGRTISITLDADDKAALIAFLNQ